MKELNINEMEMATGGVQRVVNTGVADLNAAVRSGPSKNAKQIASLPNGTIIDTVSDNPVYDDIAQRNFVEITFTGKDGRQQTGWIAASIVGLKR